MCVDRRCGGCASVRMPVAVVLDPGLLEAEALDVGAAAGGDQDQVAGDRSPPRRPSRSSASCRPRSPRPRSPGRPGARRCPRFLNARSSSLTASWSSAAMRWSSISTIVTSVPKWWKIEANSTPTTPPPSTMRRRGTSSTASRPVESTQRAWSMPSTGGRSGLRAGGDHRVLEVHRLAALHGDLVGPGEAPAAVDHGDPVGLEEPAHPADHPVDDLPLVDLDLAEVDLRARHGDPELGERARGPPSARARSAPRPWSGCSRR